jgi:hypothetical protein
MRAEPTTVEKIKTTKKPRSRDMGKRAERTYSGFSFRVLAFAYFVDHGEGHKCAGTEGAPRFCDLNFMLQKSCLGSDRILLCGPSRSLV